MQYVLTSNQGQVPLLCGVEIIDANIKYVSRLAAGDCDLFHKGGGKLT